MTSQTLSTVSRIATLRKRAGTLLWRFVFSPMITCMHAAMLAVVLLVLLPWLALDFLPRRRDRSRSMCPSPPRRKREIPIRNGSDIFVIKQDGTKEPVDALEAATIAKMWADVTTGAFVYEKTRVRLDESA